MKEKHEPMLGPFEHIKMNGTRGAIQKFIFGKDLVMVQLDAYPGKELYLRGEGYVRWKGLKHRHGDILLGDQLSFEQLRNLCKSNSDDQFPPINSIAVERDIHNDELERGVVDEDCRWGIVFVSKPNV